MDSVLSLMIVVRMKLFTSKQMGASLRTTFAAWVSLHILAKLTYQFS